jgi:putative transcriptional regulator
MYTRHAPGFLLATPSLMDPIFKQTVVLLFHHDAGGASGLVFNRPSDQAVGDLLSSIGLTPRDERMAAMLVGFGGPVAPGIGWVVYEGSEGRDESFSLADDLQVSGSRTVLERLLKHDPALRMRFVLGYAGWAPGQLEAEIEAGAWVTMSVDREILFESPPEDGWKAAYARLGIDPGMWSTSMGNG